MNVLVSGTSSGLGHYLQEAFGAKAYDRAQPALAETQAPYDAIVHCAFNKNDKETPEKKQQSVALTQALIDIPHGLFVYVSTADIYPKDGGKYDENTPLSFARDDVSYAATKYACEQLVQRQCRKSLILRPVMMLGKDMRKNNLTRLLEEEHAQLTLSAQSSYNCILHKDVAAFIRLALEQNLTGIFNLAAASNVTLGELATAFNRSPQFGSHTYEVGHIDNKKAAALLTVFQRSSLENIRQVFSSQGR